MIPYARPQVAARTSVDMIGREWRVAPSPLAHSLFCLAGNTYR